MNESNLPIFTYSEDPSPHLIIDNFFQKRMARDILDEWIKLEPFYEPAKIVGDDDAPLDDCEACKAIKHTNRNAIRDNDVVYLDTKFKGSNREQSITLREIHRVLFGDPVMKLAIESYGGLFTLLTHVTHSSSILSSYGKCDFYGWHKDTIPGKWAERVMTVIVYLNEEPFTFKGGELIIGGDKITKQKIIEPKHNRVVIFPSSIDHAVNNVTLDDDAPFSQRRFSLNFWLGFDGGIRFR